MDRLSRIRNIIQWQELYQNRKAILAIYKDDEIKLAKLTSDLENAQINKEKLEQQYRALTEKIESEENKLDSIMGRIDSMEQDRDNLKMARQIKSWEKDMERFSQDREIVEAQLYYDKSKVGELSQELEQLGINIISYQENISTLEKELSTAKAETADELESIEKGIDDISKEFDTHFVEYFDRLLIKNKGIVMAMVDQDSCSGCNVLLPTSYHGGDLLQDAEDSALSQCPNCFRYLYYNEDI